MSTKDKRFTTSGSATGPTNRGMVLTGRCRLSIEQVSIPQLRPGHVIVKTAYLGLCGSDARMFDGSSVFLPRGSRSTHSCSVTSGPASVYALAADVTDLDVGPRVVGHNFITCET